MLKLQKGRQGMFIAMNNFKVTKGREEDFENAWRARESHLDGVAGFVHFALLKGDAEGEYASHTTWTSREAFLDWTRSSAFAAGHRQGSLAGVLEGPPAVKLFESVLEQEPSKAPA
jgi:heme-degrading monooxygenase HmoA